MFSSFAFTNMQSHLTPKEDNVKGKDAKEFEIRTIT